eukprot:Hpha_TRINITY_DN5102_c0_g1::TRINITY_DN5102_c0_g1_i1::g.193164::m.193164
MDVDPRSGVPILTRLPEEFSGFGLDNAVLHWIGHVFIYDPHWGSQQLVGLVSDSCWYCCDRRSRVTHCLRIPHMDELLIGVSPADGLPVLGMRAWRAEDHSPVSDLLIGFPAGPRQREHVTGLMQTLYSHMTGGMSLPIRPVADAARMLTLAATGHTVVIEPILSKSKLLEEVQQYHQDPNSGAYRNPLRLATPPPQQGSPMGSPRALPSRGGRLGEPLTVNELEGELFETKEELRRSKQALKQALRAQAEELDAIRQEFLGYDREVVQYLNALFSRFPHARTALGSPPTISDKRRSNYAGADWSPTGGHQEGSGTHEDLLLRGLTAENTALRRRLKEAEQSAARPYPGPVQWAPQFPQRSAPVAGRRPYSHNALPTDPDPSRQRHTFLADEYRPPIQYDPSL